MYPNTAVEPVVIYHEKWAATKAAPPGIRKAETTDGDGDGRQSQQQSQQSQQSGNLPTPVRLHDQCFTSEVLGSRRCDCKEQLTLAMDYIRDNGGIIIYLQQEGRGIGLANKVAAYALQDEGLDTVDANLHLGFGEDERTYGVVPAILEDLGITEPITLLTNNPFKVDRLRELQVNVQSTVPMVVPNPNKFNRKYLQTKVDRMRHKNFGDMKSLDMTSLDMTSLVSSISGGGTDMDPSASSSSSPTLGARPNDDGYCFGRQSVLSAVSAIRRGEMVCVVDDMDRENEGDLIIASDKATPESISRMVRYTSGVLCCAMEGERMDQLNLPPMVVNNEDPKGTAFSVSVDANKSHGISTGISARDRAKTCNLLAR